MLNMDLLNIAVDKGPVVDDIVLETEVDGLEEDADGVHISPELRALMER